MHVHLPKALHGWRELLKEIGIIVIGVSIALGAEQGVELIHWRGEAAHASRTIKLELAHQRLDALERLAVQPCLSGQLQALATRLGAFQGGMWRGMPMIVHQQGIADAAQRSVLPAYRAPERLWVSEAWQTARSNGSLNHLPDDVVSAYAQAYNRGGRIIELQVEESRAAARLAPLAVDGLLGTQERASLLGSIAEVDHANAVIVNQARQLIAALRPLLRDLPAGEVDKQVREMTAAQRQFRGNCVASLRLN